MGTRSLTVFNNEMDNSEIVVLYRQYDGYPTGHGRDLLSFLNNMEVALREEKEILKKGHTDVNKKVILRTSPFLNVYKILLWKNQRNTHFKPYINQ